MDAAPPHYNTVVRTIGDLMAPDAVAKNNNDEWLNETFLQDLYDRAWAYGSETRGMSEAQEWAKDAQGVPFSFSEAELAKDATDLRILDLNLDKLVQKRQDQLRDNGRLSLESIDETLTPETLELLDDLRDVQRLMELARGVFGYRRPQTSCTNNSRKN